MEKRLFGISEINFKMVYHKLTNKILINFISLHKNLLKSFKKLYLYSFEKIVVLIFVIINTELMIQFNKLLI